MSKKLIFALIIFFITLVAFLYIKFVYLRDIPAQALPTSLTPHTITENASLSFSPNTLTLTGSRSASINILLQSQANLNLVQLEIGFDPSALYNVTITPGNYFLAPEILLDNTDFRTGRISYALKGVHDQTTHDTNIVVTLTFNALSYGIKRQTQLLLLPKTIIRDTKGEIKLDSITNADITLPPVFIQNFATVSATPKP